MKTLMILIIGVLLLVGCKEQTPINEQSPEVTRVGRLNYVYRHIDDEASVVCWIYSSANNGGIDCLPIEQTRLGE